MPEYGVPKMHLGRIALHLVKASLSFWIAFIFQFSKNVFWQALYMCTSCTLHNQYIFSFVTPYITHESWISFSIRYYLLCVRRMHKTYQKVMKGSTVDIYRFLRFSGNNDGFELRQNKAVFPLSIIIKYHLNRDMILLPKYLFNAVQLAAVIHFST